MLSSLAASCTASALSGTPQAQQQAGVLNHGLPGVAAMFPAATCDGHIDLSSELQAMQQLVDELNSNPVHSPVCAATAAGFGPVKPVSRVLHLPASGPNELLRSRLAQASHDLSAERLRVQSSIAGSPMAAVDALLLESNLSGCSGVPALSSAAALAHHGVQQQLQSSVAGSGAAGLLQAAQFPASDLHCLPHILTRSLGRDGSSLMGSGNGWGHLNLMGADAISSPVHPMSPAAVLSAAVLTPTCGTTAPSCLHLSACPESSLGVRAMSHGNLENNMALGSVGSGCDSPNLLTAQQQLLQQHLLQQQLAQQVSGAISSCPADSILWAHLLS
jgi:hypothetical protein